MPPELELDSKIAGFVENLVKEGGEKLVGTPYRLTLKDGDEHVAVILPNHIIISSEPVITTIGQFVKGADIFNSKSSNVGTEGIEPFGGNIENDMSIAGFFDDVGNQGTPIKTIFQRGGIETVRDWKETILEHSEDELIGSIRGLGVKRLAAINTRLQIKIE